MAGSASSKGIRAGGAYVEVGADLSPLRRKLNQAGSMIRGLGLSLMGMGASVTGPLIGLASLFANNARQMSLLAEETGLTVEQISALGYAARRSGADSEDLEKGVMHLNRMIAEAASGSKGAEDHLARLGLTFQDLAPMSTYQRLLAVSEGLRRIEDPGIRSGLTMATLGRHALGLVPLLSRGAAGIRELTRDAQEMGHVISAEDAAASREMMRDLAALTNGLKLATYQIGAGLIPGLRAAYADDRKLAQAIVSTGKAVGLWLRENKQLVKTIFLSALGATAFGASIMVIGTVLPAVVRGIAALTGVSALFSFLASPLGIFVAGLVAAGAGIVLVLDRMGKLDNIVSTFREGWTTVSGDFEVAWDGIKTAIMSGDMPAALRVAGALMGLEWARATSWLEDKWRDVWGGMRITTARSQSAIADFLLKGMAGWRIAWQYTLTFFGDGWRTLMTAMCLSWQATFNAFARSPLGRVLGIEEDATDHIAQFNREVDAAHAERDSNVDRIHADTENASAELQRMRDQEILAVSNQRQRERMAAEREAEQRIGDARAELDRASIGARVGANLRRLLRGQFGEGGPGGEGGGPVGTTAHGTFSGAALAGLVTAGGNPVVNAVERVEERVNQLVQPMNRIQDLIQRGGGRIMVG